LSTKVILEYLLSMHFLFDSIHFRTTTASKHFSYEEFVLDKDNLVSLVRMVVSFVHFAIKKRSFNFFFFEMEVKDFSSSIN
jgi:hypothetical protein